jgi:hypothetical protein
MNDLIWILYQFLGLMIARLFQKYDAGWDGWEIIEKEDYVRRAMKNLECGDYVDAANLCMLAYYAREQAMKEASHEST